MHPALKEAAEAYCRNKSDFLKKSVLSLLHSSVIARNVVIVDKYNLIAPVFALLDPSHHFVQIDHLVVLHFFS